MLFLRQSTASQEIMLGPFVDDTDGKTAETGLTIANTDIKLWVEGGTTEASKTSGGATHIASGRYYCVLDATDTATLGKMEINVHVAGALPVRREFMVLSANVYDSLVSGSDLLDISVVQLLGTAWLTPGTAGTPDVNVKLISDDATAANNAEAFFDGTGYAGTNNVIPTVTTATNVTTVNGLAANVITAASIAADAITDAKVHSDVTIASVTGSVNSVTSGVTVTTNNDKTGYALSIAGVQAIWDALTSALTVVGSIGKLLVDNINATISSRSTYAGGDTAGTTTLLTRLVGTIAAGTHNPQSGDSFALIGTTGSGLTSLASASNLATVAGYLDTEIQAILDDTNELQTDWANGGRLDLILDSASAPSAAAVADAVWDELLSGHSSAGSAGLALSTASSGGVDPSVLADAIWDEIISGHVIAGSAGNLLADILVDTGTTLQGELDGIQADTEDIQTRLPAALVSGRIDASVGAMAANVLTASALATDAVTEIQSGLATPTNITAGTITTVTNLTNAPTTGDLTATMKASVNTEVLDVLNVDTFAELSAPPAATSSLRAKLTWLFMWSRNKATATATQRKLYADDGTTVVSTEALSDDATTYTKGEAS